MIILIKAVKVLEGGWRFVSWPNRWEIECTSQFWWSFPWDVNIQKSYHPIYTQQQSLIITLRNLFGGWLNCIKSELMSTCIDKWKCCLFFIFLYKLLHTNRSATPVIEGFIGKSWIVVFIFGLCCGLEIFQTSTPKQEDCIPPSTVFLVYGQMDPPKGTGPLIWKNQTLNCQLLFSKTNINIVTNITYLVKK